MVLRHSLSCQPNLMTASSQTICHQQEVPIFYSAFLMVTNPIVALESDSISYWHISSSSLSIPHDAWLTALRLNKWPVWSTNHSFLLSAIKCLMDWQFAAFGQWFVKQLASIEKWLTKAYGTLWRVIPLLFGTVGHCMS